MKGDELKRRTKEFAHRCVKLAVALPSKQISDHQRSWGHEDGPWKGPGSPLLVAADF